MRAEHCQPVDIYTPRGAGRVMLEQGAASARVTRVDRGACDVLSESGPARLHLPAGLEVTVGDWVSTRDSEIEAVLPRSSLLVRGAASGTSRPQLLAANVDAVLVCTSLSGRLPLRRIERLVTLAWGSGATPVVVLTKADLHDDPGAVQRQVRTHAPGVDVVLVGAAAGDVSALSPWTGAGQTIVLLGTSGAGKSTIVNALAGHQVMSTGSVRAADDKGRHTTTHRELIVLPGGAVVIDTPGLRGVSITGDVESLTRAFADVEDLAQACRFADCAHAGEPGCAVQASIDAGDLSDQRMQSWRQLQRELAFQARRTDARLRAAEKVKWKTRHREQRERGGRR